jgi:UDP-glucose 4-epimerase
MSMLLVTGGAGFIGSHLVDAGMIMGSRVRVLDNLTSGNLSNLSSAKKSGRLDFMKGDVTNRHDVEKAVKGVELVFHEAAVVSIPKSLEQPELINKVNTEGTINLLEACRKYDVQRFIFAGSSSIYGEAEHLPISEQTSPRPLSPYAVSKLAAESYCQMYWRLYSLPTISLRYFNVYGPRQTSSEYSGVVSRFLDAINGDKPLTVFGDGKQTRDFIYVDDVVAASLQALRSDRVFGNAFNIATGIPTSIGLLAETMLKVAHNEALGVSYEPRRPGDICHSYASIDRASDQLQFRPRVQLKEGLEKLFYWSRAN